MSRAIVVDAARLARWVAGFEERRGTPVQLTSDGPDVVLDGVDGERARLVFPAPDVLVQGTTFDDVDAFAGAVLEPRRTAVVLARRGGYACALVDGDRVEVSKVGTRYVQGRTAAGGWSQQRFARRRANQTDDLVGACTEHAVRLLAGARAHLVVTGGDRELPDRVLADPRLRALAALPRGRRLDVGDPRSEVVKKLPLLLRQVTVQLSAPATDQQR
jgi:hypothetical protein